MSEGSPPKNEDTMVVMNISEIIIHPKKEKNRFVYDIALLKMEKEIDFMKHDYIRPVCLPENSLEEYVGRDTIITGWGLIG